MVLRNGTIADHFEAWFPSVLKGMILVCGPLSQGPFPSSISFDALITEDNLNPSAFEVPTGNVNH